ncbi:hypothetical protein [Ramlibacter sp.]|uniref:hypothetical protein n=1 Tax=Ramlibacter sp. TaxID=1917967 RepID=UPI002616A919|nr:hypothetical protein [Ramlibacter sp.]MDB5955483.1 hypothetical protein [Ramlibacter sp.]
MTSFQQAVYDKLDAFNQAVHAGVLPPDAEPAVAAIWEAFTRSATAVTASQIEPHVELLGQLADTRVDLTGVARAGEQLLQAVREYQGSS